MAKSIGFAFASLMAMLAGLAASQTVPTTIATNTSSYMQVGNAQVYLLVNDGYTYVNPLNQASHTILPNSPSANSGLEGYVYLTTPMNYENVTHENLALVSCDTDYYKGNIGQDDIVKSAVQNNATAIIFYSMQYNFCNLSDPSYTGYNRLYTLTQYNTSQNVVQIYTDKQQEHDEVTYGFILADNAYKNSDSPASPSTATAMYILYSITGVITALFLVIIITGAIRAHRHPERYGPRNVLGRARQSRARGIARAMLDTIPIVKFGDQSAPKATDVELASSSTTHESRDISRSVPSQSEKSTAEVHESAGPTSSQPETARAAPDIEDESLGCSICTDDFEKGQDIRVLPCNHKFHPACVDPWLLDVSGTCPLCRVDLRPRTSNDTTREEEGVSGELPPPLDPANNGRSRRDTLRALFFNPRSVQSANAEERIAALRRFRQNHRNIATQNANTRQRDGSAAGEAQTTAGAVESPISPEDETRRWTKLRGFLARKGGNGTAASPLANTSAGESSSSR